MGISQNRPQEQSLELSQYIFYQVNTLGMVRLKLHLQGTSACWPVTSQDTGRALGLPGSLQKAQCHRTKLPRFQIITREMQQLPGLAWPLGGLLLGHDDAILFTPKSVLTV